MYTNETCIAQLNPPCHSYVSHACNVPHREGEESLITHVNISCQKQVQVASYLQSCFELERSFVRQPDYTSASPVYSLVERRLTNVVQRPRMYCAGA
jgi:hypothetical protein